MRTGGLRATGLRATGLSWAAGIGGGLVSHIRKRWLALIVMKVTHCSAIEVTIQFTICTAFHGDPDEATQ